MPKGKINDLGRAGIISDEAPDAIPANAFSAGKNIRFRHGQLRNFGGHQLVTTAPVEPYGLFSVRTPNRETYWLEAGLNKVYVYDGSNHTDITRITGDYNTDEYTDRWTGDIVADLGFLNNGAGDGAQVWSPINIATKLVDMAYDPGAAAGSKTWQELGYRAYSMRSYKACIFAMNLNRGASILPSTIQWCDFLNPGDTEPDFVATPQNSAGERTLGETTGNILDAGPLRDDFIIYKEDSAWRCSFTGDASNPFIFERLPGYVKIINRGCIGVSDEFHVLASRDDVKIFDGNTFRSILDSKRREFYKGTIFPERILTTFVSVLQKETEVWICFPRVGNPGEIKHPDAAIVWNSEDGTISDTDLPQCRDMDAGIIVPQIFDRFDDLVPTDLTFDQDTARFDQTPFTAASDFMVGAHSTSISTFGDQPTDDGKPRECIAERTGLVLEDPKTGILTSSAQPMLSEVRVYMTATGPISIQIGAQNHLSGPISWLPEQTFDPMKRSFLNFRVTFAYLAYRIRSNADVAWNVTKIEFEYKPSRRR